MPLNLPTSCSLLTLILRANPLVRERIKTLKGQNRHYLAHEYFNRDWHPMHFSSMAEWLEPAKVSFACSANFLDHLDGVNLTAEQQVFLKEITDPMFRELVRDFMVNQQFRKDYWVKGVRRMSALDQIEFFNRQKIILTAHRPDLLLKATGAQGEVTLNEAIYNPIFDLLADHKARTIGQISSALKDKGINFAQIIQAVLTLGGVGAVSPVQDDAVTSKTRKNADRLNAYLIDKARGSGDVNFLASSVTGGGVAVGRMQQLFLLALSRGRKQPQEWAEFAWEILAGQGQKIIKEGKALETPAENLTEITEQAKAVAEKSLSVLKALQIA